LVLHAFAVKGSAGPIIDLNADFWKAVPAVTVSTQPQTIANPQNPSPAIGEFSVPAAHNGQWLAYLIEWADPTKSDRIVVDQFGDQVAIEMPVKFAPGDSPQMARRLPA
jgi:DMSO reductase family type II enzyme heme b subunit